MALKNNALLVLATCLLGNSGCSVTSLDEQDAASVARSAFAVDAEGGASEPSQIVHSQAEISRMREFLSKRNVKRQFKKVLETKSGRRVECVDINTQASLRGERVAAAPKVINANKDVSTIPDGAILAEPLFAAGTTHADKCPTGSVPMPEITLDDLLRFPTLDDFLAKEPSTKRRSGEIPGWLEDHVFSGPKSLHQYADAFRFVKNWGGEARVAIWSAFTERDTEFSLGQIWVSGQGERGTETVEAGLQRHRAMYNDDDAHLFIYSTRDNYTNSSANPGCYNNACNDFVQVSSNFFPGMSFGKGSTKGGSQYELHIHWTKAGDTGDWWLSVAGEYVGYYRRSAFKALANHAESLAFGGEIIDERSEGRHTKTQMGSGSFPTAGFGQAAYMRQIRYHDSNPKDHAVTWADLAGLIPRRDGILCYNVVVNESSVPADWYTYLFYGGPGFDEFQCH